MTGAIGNIGRELVPLLVAAGDAVHIATRDATKASLFGALVGLHASGALRVAIQEVFAFADVAAAHRVMEEGGHHRGKTQSRSSRDLVTGATSNVERAPVLLLVAADHAVRVATHIASKASLVGALVELCARDALRVAIQQVFGFDDVAAAHRVMEGGHVRGKIALAGTTVILVTGNVGRELVPLLVAASDAVRVATRDASKASLFGTLVERYGCGALRTESRQVFDVAAAHRVIEGSGRMRGKIAVAGPP